MNRNAQIKTERKRRRQDHLAGVRRRLAVDMSKLDPAFEYRFVNDDAGRVEFLTKSDDWEVVSDREGEIKADGANTGSEVSAVVGVGEYGRPVRGVLLRKPKDWYDEDKAAKARRIDETDAAVRAGRPAGAPNDGNTYQDITLSHGSKA